MADESKQTTGKAWFEPISPERQAVLQGYLDRWEAEADHGRRNGPFDKEPGEYFGVYLTGADVSWLAAQSGSDEGPAVSNLHLEGACLGGAHLEGASLYVLPDLGTGTGKTASRSVW